MNSQSWLELQSVMAQSYIKAGASYHSYQFIRTCVLDSHLAAFHITTILFPNVKDLLNSDGLFKDLMDSLNAKKYAEAKFLCAQHLKHVTFDLTHEVIDFYGIVFDHFSLFDKLVCAEMVYNQKIPKGPIRKEILCRMEHQRLMVLSYIEEGTSYRSYQFIRTCVIDSHLAAFHPAYTSFPNVKYPFSSNFLFKDIMALLKDKKYDKAKFVYDHFSLFDKLVCAEEIPNDPIHEEILSNFNTFDYVMALGDPADPTLILGYHLTTDPPFWVTDKKNRLFKLQFLLLGKEDHMTMCFHVPQNGWYFYDNDLKKTSFQTFDFERLNKNDVYEAGYVNITQAHGYKLGVTETGEGTGARLFHSEEASYPQQSVADVEMEDLQFSIPKMGERLGPMPF